MSQDYWAALQNQLGQSNHFKPKPTILWYKSSMAASKGGGETIQKFKYKNEATLGLS